MFLLLLPVLLFGSAYFAYRLGWWTFAILLPLVVSAAAVGLDSGSIVAFACVIIIGWAAGFIIIKKISLMRYVLAVPILITALLSGDYYWKLSKGNDIIADSKKQMTELFMKADGVSKEEKEAMAGFVNVFVDVIKNIFPFVVFIYALVFSGIGYITVKFFLFLYKRELPVNGLPSFDLNGYIVFPLIGAWAAVLLGGGNKTVFTAALNGALIISALYLVQALGIVSFFLKKKNMPDYLMVILVILLFFFSMSVGVFLVIMLAGFGLLDLWADFRKIRIGDNKTAGS
ncbi:MAG: YybS family protein [Spirochaetia bacterium]|jgi:hypothetical protein|nr:YybS family protein [Spirochaetia bacterium]